MSASGRDKRTGTAKSTGTSSKKPVAKKAVKQAVKKAAPTHEGGAWAAVFTPRTPGERRYWLVKSEPSTFSFDDLMAAKGRTTHWDGVRNFVARNFMRDGMKAGDQVLFYHSSVNPQAIVGVCEVAREVGFPHALREPESRVARTESVLKILAHPRDLLQAILARQRGQHGLIEAGEQELRAARAAEAREIVDERAVVAFAPLEQRSGHVQNHRPLRTRRQMGHQRSIHVADV